MGKHSIYNSLYSSGSGKNKTTTNRSPKTNTQTRPKPNMHFTILKKKEQLHALEEVPDGAVDMWISRSPRQKWKWGDPSPNHQRGWFFLYQNKQHTKIIPNHLTQLLSVSISYVDILFSSLAIQLFNWNLATDTFKIRSFVLLNFKRSLPYVFIWLHFCFE